MLQILTVCGNGIGSSNLLAMKINQLSKAKGIALEAKSMDFNSARGQKADLIVTVKEFADQFPKGSPVVAVRSYVNKKQIEEDVFPHLQALIQKGGQVE